MSGKSTPDTFRIKRLSDNSVMIQERVIGDKSLRITVSGTKSPLSLVYLYIWGWLFKASLTHYMETCERVIGKQCRPRSDAT